MITISLKHVSKKFHIGSNESLSMPARVWSTISGKERRKSFLALKDVSIEIRSGEVIGVVGANGAGKSTLLSVIAGVYMKYEGEMSVKGKVISVIGLVNGLRDRLSLIDNLHLCTALYGYSRADTKRIEKNVVQFAKLEGYENTKLFQFSTGMIARLVFSIATHVNPSILLLDEITSNLDEEFVFIVKSTIKKLTDEGVTVIVVSHNKNIIMGCDKALYIDKGELKLFASSQEVIKTYFKE